MSEFHKNIDCLRDISDVNEQSLTIIAQAYSEESLPMQIRDE